MYHYLTTELNTDPTFAALRTILIAGSVCVVVLTLLTLYHKDLLTVLSVIEYELRMGFKETVFEAPRLGQYSFLFGALSNATAVFAARTFGFQSPLFVLRVSQAIKFFAVNSSWAGFLRCHR